MSKPYTQHFRTRIYEMDAWQRMRSSALLRYMEEAATGMSTAAGHDLNWYATHGTAWMMRGVKLQRFENANTGDDLIITTWVSSTQKVRLFADYEIRHNDSNNTPVAVGRCEWVYIDWAKKLPRPLDPEIMTEWPSLEPSRLWEDGIQPPLVMPPEHSYEPHAVPHTVYCYDAEALGQTNYAVYADWFEEAAREALRAWGYPLEMPQLVAPKLRLDMQSLAIQYFGPTRPGYTVTITTNLTGVDGDVVAVAQDIRLGGFPATAFSLPNQTADQSPLVRAETVYRLQANPSVETSDTLGIANTVNA